MYVEKRNGATEPVDFGKIQTRIERISKEINSSGIDVPFLAQKVIGALKKGISTHELDVVAANIAQPMAYIDPAYGELAARILVSNHHKNVQYKLWIHFKHDDPELTLDQVRAKLHYYVQKALLGNTDDDGRKVPMLRGEMNVDESWFDYSRDYLLDYAGFLLLEKSYLVRVNLRGVDGKMSRHPIEYPQHLFMRVAYWISPQVRECYDGMSQFKFTHATPTLFNAGTVKQQCSSCFLMQVADDSIEGIMKWCQDCAITSKYSGGLGSSVHKVRCRGSYIAGTNGRSNGLSAWLRLPNVISEVVDQGGDKRPGTHAIYLEPWHGDIHRVLELKQHRGSEQQRAKHLFYGMWISDKFMRAVQNGEPWYLMCPNSCPGLSETYGEEHTKLYEKYVAEGKYVEKIMAQDLFMLMLKSIAETGGPYIMFKDNANRGSNQTHLGTIQGSNLCTEILLYTSAEETAVCNLASVCLPRFVNNGVFDYVELGRIVQLIVKNLDTVIDITYYPTKEAEYSNKKHRPMGIGIQGLADLFTVMNLPFNSEAANVLQYKIMESMYYNALVASCDLAQAKGKYASYEGSPISKGILHFDIYGEIVKKYGLSCDWDKLRADIAKYGIRNSTLIALMPTASTSTIMGMSPCFEPHNSLIYKRVNTNGEVLMFNKYFVKEMIELKLWDTKLQNAILLDPRGSIADCQWLPAAVRDKYRTAWDISARDVVHSAEMRVPFVDQAQSMNLFIANPTPRELSGVYFRAWKAGLPNGSYYVRRLAPADAQKVQVVAAKSVESKVQEGEVCYMQDGCLSCQ